MEGCCLLARTSACPWRQRGKTLLNCRAFGAALLMFSFLGGFIGDAYGFEFAAVCGSLLSVLGYTAMSFSRNTWQLFLTYIFVGLGGGTMVVAALSTAVVVGRAYAISTVALCVSLSIAFANFLQSSVSDRLCHMGFTDDGTVEGSAACWRTDLRVYAVAIFAFSCLGLPLMFPAVSAYLADKLLAACGCSEQQVYSKVETPAQQSSPTAPQLVESASHAASHPKHHPAAPQPTGLPNHQAPTASSNAELAKPPLSPATPLLRAGKVLQQPVLPSPGPSLGQPRVQLSSAGAGPAPLASRSLSHDSMHSSPRLQGLTHQTRALRQLSARSTSGSEGGLLQVHTPPYMSRLLSFRQSLVVMRERYFWVLMLADITAAGVGTYAVTAIPGIVNDVVNPCAVRASIEVCMNDPQKALYGGKITVSLVLTLFSVLNGVANVSMPLLAGWLHGTGRMRLHRFWACTMVATTLLLGGMGYLSLLYGTQGGEVALAPQGLRDLFCVMVACLGFSFGTTLAVFPQIVADGFGSINYGKIFSLVQVGLVGFSVGLPPAANAVVGATGGWAWCHIGMGVLLLLSATLLWAQHPRSTGWRTSLKTVPQRSERQPLEVHV